MPLGGHLRSSGNLNDNLRDGLNVRVDTTIADDIVGRDICDRLANKIFN